VDFHVSLDGRGDLTARIYRQLLAAILDGRLLHDERLPASRELARRLDVSRNTVAAAYERLAAEGFVSGRAGAGTYVCAPQQLSARRAPSGGVRSRPIWDIPLLTPAGPAEYEFRIGVPDPRLFPLATWRRFVSQELRPVTLRPADYGDPAGHPAARIAIARHVGISRSVRVGPEDVLITQGAQQALDLVGRVLIEPGDCVAVEEPGYRPARRIFHALGARVVGVPVDGEGLDVTALPPDAKLVYVTPSHQFPLGTAMSLARRAALLAWAERHDAVVIEDDYDSEFRFSDRPLDPLQSLDRLGRVIYVGSFSKTLLPMLRLGFVIAPTSLQPALLVAKQLSDWNGDRIAQAALARLIDEGLLARHIRKATRAYAARHEQIGEVLRRDFVDLLEPVPSVAGLHLCARLVAPGIDLGAAVRRSGVVVRTVGSFSTTPHSWDGLVLGYGTIQPERIGEGLRRLLAGLRG
jgi:GntR family transcriptional regulator / MocR family aminotransferase